MVTIYHSSSNGGGGGGVPSVGLRLYGFVRLLLNLVLTFLPALSTSIVETVSLFDLTLSGVQVRLGVWGECAMVAFSLPPLSPLFSPPSLDLACTSRFELIQPVPELPPLIIGICLDNECHYYGFGNSQIESQTSSVTGFLRGLHVTGLSFSPSVLSDRTSPVVSYPETPPPRLSQKKNKTQSRSSARSSSPPTSTSSPPSVDLIPRSNRSNSPSYRST